MVSNWLSDDSLLYIKEEMTLMGAIGLEPVSAIFQPKSAICAQSPKIAMHIKDMSKGVNLKQILLTLRDLRKNGLWTMKIQFDHLEQTLKAIFIRIKEFHSLNIFAADPADQRKMQQLRLTSFDHLLPRLSMDLINAAASFPAQSISFRRLFFPPHSEAMTIPLDAVFKLITYLAPSLLQLRFCYNRSANTENCQWERLFSVLSEKCPGLQKLKIGGVCNDWSYLPNGLNALTSLRSFELLAFDAKAANFWFPAAWLRNSFQHNHNLKHLSVSFNALSILLHPSAALILSRLEALDINFIFSMEASTLWFYMNERICNWIAQEGRNACAGQSVLLRLLMALPHNGGLTMRLNCSTADVLSSAESLAKVVFKVAEVTSKHISARFIHCFDMTQVTERLKNQYPLLEVDQSRQHRVVFRRVTATCAFSD